jgi:hypothetical protein
LKEHRPIKVLFGIQGQKGISDREKLLETIIQGLGFAEDTGGTEVVGVIGGRGAAQSHVHSSWLTGEGSHAYDYRLPRWHGHGTVEPEIPKIRDLARSGEAHACLGHCFKAEHGGQESFVIKNVIGKVEVVFRRQLDISHELDSGDMDPRTLQKPKQG